MTETTPPSTSATNPADAQVSPEYPPDKYDAWPYPPEEESGRISHRALRHELALLDTALTALYQQQTLLEKWHLKALQQALVQGHLARIYGRIRAEQDLLIPILSQRYVYPTSLSEDLQPLVLKCIDALQPLLKALNVGDTISNDIFDAWTTYLETETRLLDEKERTLFVLNRHYFSHAELKDTEGLQMYTRSHKWDVASLAFEMGADNFCTIFMTRERIPWYMWTLYFKGQLSAYERELVHNTHALAWNVPPNSAEFQTLWLEQEKNNHDRLDDTVASPFWAGNAAILESSNKDDETRSSVVVAVSAS